MTLISEKMWGFSKTSIVISAVLVFLLCTWSSFVDGGVTNLLFTIAVFAPLAVLFARYMLKLESCLADEVYDCGEYLLIRKSGEEEKLLLSNITTVSSSNWENGPLVTLRLAKPGQLGGIIKFFAVPPNSFSFFRNEIAQNLTARIGNARTRLVASQETPLK